MNAHRSASAFSAQSSLRDSARSAADSAPEGPALTIGEAARRLGVAVETLRSWERRYELGPEERSKGAHRRYTPADMARLDHFCRLVGEGVASVDAAAAVRRVDGPDPDAAPRPALGSADTAPTPPGGGRTLPIGRSGSALARGLARCAVRMDTGQVLALLEEAIAREGVVAAWEKTIEPALLAVGRKWSESQGRYVEVEHLISWCIAAALHRVPLPDPAPAASSEAEEPARRRVLLACAPDEWHSLPMEVLRVALVERRVPVCMLGAAVPPEALQAAVRRLDPARVVIWSQDSRTSGLGVLPKPLDPGRTRVLLAGPGWRTARSKGIGVLGSLDEAVRACAGATASAPV